MHFDRGRTGRLAALICMLGVFGHAQGRPSAETEQHRRDVEAGLLPRIVMRGDAHPGQPIAGRMAALHVRGVSVAVLHHGVIEWAKGYGQAGESGQAVTPETIFQAGSISKPLAAMAALRMVQDGKLSLDADVNSELKSWKLPPAAVTEGQPVTLRELLTHTAGLTVHGFPGYAAGAAVPSLVEVLNGEKPANTPAIRSEAKPGARWNYSGGGYTVMQQMVVDAAGKPFPDVMRETVLRPIGMTHSTYEQPLPEAMRGEAATPYNGEGKPITGGAHTYPEMAAAGLWTTPTDLLKYVMEVRGSMRGEANHVLSAEMTRQMLTKGMGGWGLGLEIGGSDANPYFAHGGVNEGFQSTMTAYEKDGEGAVIMTNADGGMNLAMEVLRSIAEVYKWPDYRAVVQAVVAVDPKTLASYAGTYEIAPKFDLVVTVENGRLMTQGTGQSKEPLVAESQTKFVPVDFEAELEFVKDAQGQVTHMLLTQGGQVRKAPRK